MRKQRIQSFDDLCKSHRLGCTGDQVLAAWEAKTLQKSVDYQNAVNMESILGKSLTTTNSGPITVPRTSPLMLENMDGLMTEVLVTQEHLKIARAINAVTVPSPGPTFEWNRHSSFGHNRGGGLGFSEGNGPVGAVSAFERHNVQNKFLGRAGGLTHQMLTAGTNGGTVEDPETRENHDRTLELFESLERAVLFSDATITDNDGVAVNWDGLLNLMAAQNAANVIDKKGLPLTFQDLDEAALTLVKGGKQQTVNGYTSFHSVNIADGLNRQFADRNMVRTMKESEQKTYVPGQNIPGYQGQFGTIDFEHSIMMEEVPDSAPLDAASAGAPATPTTVTSAAADDATSLMDPDTYYYSIAAFNDSGESLPLVSDAQIVGVGQKVTLTITKVTGATGFRIYRGLLADGSDAKWVDKVAQPAAGATFTWTDLNNWRTTDVNGAEGNGLSLIIKPDPRDICMAQMLPLMKFPLPPNKTTFPFYLLLYCVLVLKAPERVLIFKNCGTYTSP